MLTLAEVQEYHAIIWFGFFLVVAAVCIVGAIWFFAREQLEATNGSEIPATEKSPLSFEETPPNW